MAKKENMNPDENPKKRNWKDIASARNPDLNLDDDEAVASWLEENFNQYDRINTERQQLNDLLASSPEAAGILTGLSEGISADGKPFSLMGYIIDNYWDEIQSAKTKEEAAEMASKKEAANIASAAEREKRSKSYSDNLAVSDQALTDAMNKANMDEAAVSGMLAWLYGDAEKQDGLIYRVVRNELNEEDWTRLLYAFNRDKDLDAARNDGRRESRSERGAPHRTFKGNMPADLGGGGSQMREPENEDPTVARYKKMGEKKIK